jgi:hypothetical protein
MIAYDANTSSVQRTGDQVSHTGIGNLLRRSIGMTPTSACFGCLRTASRTKSLPWIRSSSPMVRSRLTLAFKEIIG